MKLFRGELNWAPKMEVNVSDKFKLENFRPTVANESELKVCLYFIPIDKHVYYFFLKGFHLKSKNMEKLSPNHAQLFLYNKYTVFTVGGTVTLRSVNQKFCGELQFYSYFVAFW